MQPTSACIIVMQRPKVILIFRRKKRAANHLPGLRQHLIRQFPRKPCMLFVWFFPSNFRLGMSQHTEACQVSDWAEQMFQIEHDMQVPYLFMSKCSIEIVNWFANIFTWMWWINECSSRVLVHLQNWTFTWILQIVHIYLNVPLNGNLLHSCCP